MEKNKTLRTLIDVDDLLKLLTGKRIKDIAPRAIELFGEDLIKAFLRQPKRRPQENDPWEILEVSAGASEFIIQAAYRAMARKYHPDNRDTGDAEKFKRIQTAYEAIQAREKNKGA